MKSTTGSPGTLPTSGATRPPGRYVDGVSPTQYVPGHGAVSLPSRHPPLAERRQAQSQPPQVLCAPGERQGGGVDGRRDRVPQAETPEGRRRQRVRSARLNRCYAAVKAMSSGEV